MTTHNCKSNLDVHRSCSHLILLLAAALTTASAFAQANVAIDLTKAVNILTEASIGVPAVMFNADAFNPAGVPYLRAAGVTAMRYPGNHGVADLYHWSTRAATPYKSATAAYFAPESNFANFAQVAEKAGHGRHRGQLRLQYRWQPWR